MNEVVRTENMSLDTSTVAELTDMVAQSLNFYKETSPIYEKIARAVLDIFNNEKELANLEHKDLFKLLELSQKAQLQPIETLMKLVQNLNALYERSELAKKMDSLSKVVNSLQQSNADSGTEQRPTAIHIDEL